MSVVVVPCSGHIILFTTLRKTYKLQEENCALQGYYKESSVNPLPTFRDILSVPSSRAKNPKRIMELPLLAA
jgi:hypothetical protein